MSPLDLVSEPLFGFLVQVAVGLHIPPVQFCHVPRGIHNSVCLVQHGRGLLLVILLGYRDNSEYSATFSKLHLFSETQFTSDTLNSVYNDYVYNDIPVIAIEFHGPGHDASI